MDFASSVLASSLSFFRSSSSNGTIHFNVYGTGPKKSSPANKIVYTQGLGDHEPVEAALSKYVRKAFRAQMPLEKNARVGQA